MAPALAVDKQAARPSFFESLGVAGDFSHFNRTDPFHIKKRGSSYQAELRAGVTTFLAMAYILPVNSSMLGTVIQGEEGSSMKTQLVCATALAAAIGCSMMGLLSNWPFMLAPGMGTNAFFTFSVVMGRGLAWQAALAAVFVAGCIFVVLSVTGLRTLLIRLFPEGVKHVIGAGVGLFLTFIAFQTSEGTGITVANPATLVALNPLGSSNYDAAKIWLSLAVFCITAVLFAIKIPGAPLIGIFFGTMVCWIEGWSAGVEHSVFGYPFGTDGNRSSPLGFHIYTPDGVVSRPTLAGLSGALWSGFGAALDPKTATSFWSAVGTFCYTDLLDSSGTFFAVAKYAGLTDARGNLPIGQQNMAYLADAVAALCGSMLGVSTVCTYVESTAGVSDGGRTGLAALCTAVCFLLAVPLAPVVSAIPPLATGPILLLVGGLMFSAVKDVDWQDYEESFPAFIAVVAMPFTFNIGYGIIAGVGMWMLMQLLLVPHRLAQKTDPLIRLRSLLADATTGSEDELSDSVSDSSLVEDGAESQVCVPLASRPF